MKSQGVPDVERELRELGVPENVVRHVLREGHRTWPGQAVTVASTISFVAGTLAMFAYAIEPVRRATAEHAYLSALDAGALLLHYDRGVWPLVGIPMIISVVAALGTVAPAMSRRVTNDVFVASVLTKKPRWFARCQQRSIERSSGETNPARYVKRAVFAWAPAVVALSVLLVGITVLTVKRDIQAYSLYTPTHYIDSPFFPWNSSQPREWSSVVSVETGCSNGRDSEGARNTIMYDIRFADGQTASMARALPMTGPWLDAAEIIDRQIRTSDAVFSIRSWRNRDFKHPLCIAALRSELSDADFERIKRLLRFDD